MGIPATGLAKTGLVNLIIPLLNPVYLARHAMRTGSVGRKALSMFHDETLKS